MQKNILSGCSRENIDLLRASVVEDPNLNRLFTEVQNNNQIIENFSKIFDMCRVATGGKYCFSG